MSKKQLEISVYDENSLLVKDHTLKKRWEQKSNAEVLSDNIYLPGYETKPIRIGVYGDVTRDLPFIFIENSDFGPNDVKIHGGYPVVSKRFGESHVLYYYLFNCLFY